MALSGRVAVVTGAARGIGAACARILAQQGARVALNDLSEASTAAMVSEIERAGGEAVGVAGSIVDDGFPEHLVQTAADRWGGEHLGVIVNNAGFLWDGMAHTMPDEQFDAVVSCHLRAPFRVCRAAAAHMREAAKAEKLAGDVPRDRCVVNVSSTSGLHGNVGQVNYAAAKAGILGLTKTFAKEWGPLGIRCNAVAFGMIATRMTGDAAAHGETVEVSPGVVVPQGLPPGAAALWKDPRAVAGLIPLARAGTPEEAAGGVLLLASPFASYITGHTLEVTGGMGI